MSAWTTGRLAALVGAECRGPADRPITGVAAIDRAGPAELTFCTGGRWEKLLPTTRAGAVLLGRGEVPEGVVALVHPDPRYAYARAAAALIPTARPVPGVHPRAWVDPTAVVDGATIDALAVIEAGAVVGEGSRVMAHAYVGRDAVVGRDCRLMPHAVVMDRCRLGDRVLLQPGAVVGADGFGQAVGPDGPVRVPQLGVTILEDDVEVGANSCVDRAALTETRVGSGSRLDNLVQVAHGVEIGANCLLAAYAGVAGGAKLGDGVVMGGRAAVVDGIEVGDGVMFAGLASASRDVQAGERVGGSPARPYRVWAREVASLRQLPDLLQRFERLQRRVAELEATHEETDK